MASARLKLRLTAAAEASIRGGHPWIYSDSVRDQNRDGQPGELAVIYDRKDAFLAIGLFDPESPIRVRVLHTGKPQTLDKPWWADRLEQTLEKRRGLSDESTNGFRRINGESDGWPGLVLDRYDSTLVLKLYTAAWLPRLGEIAELIQGRLRSERIILRLSRNIQRAAAARNVAAGAVLSRDLTNMNPSLPAESWSDGQIILGAELDEPVIFLENGLRFEADVLRGQKTGFFLDQRENRSMVGSLSKDRRVLNAFSFSGGFSLYAAGGGAKSVTDLDISTHALMAAKRNFALNESNPAIKSCPHECVKADAFEWLKGDARNHFDLVVVDPPSLAKRAVERVRAIGAYEQLTEAAIKKLAPGGILVACSCSAHVTKEEFFDAVRQAAKRSGRSFTELQTTAHPQDHPATFAEANYLKGIYLRMS